MALTDNNPHLPRLILRSVADTRDLARLIADASSFSPPDTVGMIYALRYALLEFASDARPLKLEGIGIFTPSIQLNGKITIRFRPDKSLIRDLNGSQHFSGKIKNRKNISKSLSQLEEKVKKINDTLEGKSQ